MKTLARSEMENTSNILINKTVDILFSYLIFRRKNKTKQKNFKRKIFSLRSPILPMIIFFFSYYTIFLS